MLGLVLSAGKLRSSDEFDSRVRVRDKIKVRVKVRVREASIIRQI
jgi:hypothetical protein